jgi:hypothetical protein
VPNIGLTIRQVRNPVNIESRSGNNRPVPGTPPQAGPVAGI